MRIPLVATNDLHYTSPVRTPRPTTSCCASRRDATVDEPGPLPVRRRRVLPQVARGDGSRTRPLSTKRSTGRSTSPRCATSSCRSASCSFPDFVPPDGSSLDALPATAGQRGRAPACTAIRSRERFKSGLDYELDRHRTDGVRRLLPDRRRRRQLGEGQRDPRRPRPRFGRRNHHVLTAWASRRSTRSVTASSSSASSTRSAGRCRTSTSTSTSVTAARSSVPQAEVRRGPRRADRDVRDDQGEERDPRCSARARLPVRHRATGSRRCSRVRCSARTRPWRTASRVEGLQVDLRLQRGRRAPESVLRGD